MGHSVMIMAMTQILSLILSRIRQPRVISEVIGGIILGPSIMGRIPGFTNAIFPMLSLPLLNLTSTIGLVLFLFLIGLEIDFRVIKRNARSSMLISAFGLIIPLGLGAALGVPIYHQFVDPSINFGLFLLFTAVAIGITAFPVLCRILTELKLLDDTVGVVVLAAGVGNDIIGWILLALTVALVNASTGLVALWVLLTGVGYTLFLMFPVRMGFRWLARRTGSLENGTPSALMMTVTLLLVFFSAFFTDIIGIHPIFGGFLAGLIIPHENGFAISVVEKLEDPVTLLFLPLYFAFSGLKTNLGLLDNGVTWGYTILICVIAFFSKFLGCAGVATYCGFSWRESGAIGSLMSCKGLVELIVLNVGLTAGILDTRTFSMFVLHALVLTFMTTPLTLLFYPSKYRTHASAARDKASRGSVDSHEGVQAERSQETFKTKFAVVLDRVEQLPAVMTLTQLLQSPSPKPIAISSVSKGSIGDEKEPASPLGLPYINGEPSLRISVDALRLIELTDRTSAVLKSQSADALVKIDPILSVFRTFGYLNRMMVTTALAVVGYDEFPSYVDNHTRATGSEMVIIPWSSNLASIENNTVEVSNVVGSSSIAVATPFDGLFGPKNTAHNPVSAVQTQYFRKMFAECRIDVALFIDRGLPHSVDVQGRQHVFLPFFGGPDDRLALSFVVQLCLNPSTSATVVRFTKVDSNELTPVNSIQDTRKEDIYQVNVQDTVYAQGDTQTRLASDTADNVLWDQYSSSSAPAVAGALRRMKFTHEISARPLHSVLECAAKTLANQAQSRPLVVVGRSRRLAVGSHAAELRELLTEHGASANSEVAKTLGDVGASFFAANANASLLILQAAI
ncbi:hypothetical protein EW026_g5457 [Hermanssonia centrifuga]|uniref:Cation/H+ exchanger transmembrane domain-containing protein n=1 Tax=Hermanssonia centrifuga TaxID=98765 RepID=A0A4V3XA21_9APHY|nr:hypothetical protein EW026_g5457 [Hermanssonia centrifuga]